jgi:hypothetical protein
VPGKAERYFAAVGIGTFYTHPVVTRTFVPGLGWKRYPVRKRISLNWARQARAEGVTDVELRAGGHTADFRIEELVR